MILIDAQIWIYNLDPNAIENQNVSAFLEGNNEDGILFTEEIGINPVIPLEVAHNIFGNQNLNTLNLYEMLQNLFNAENITIFDINQNIMTKALSILKNYRNLGIGGRDALILATMVQEEIDTIVTHDKNILMLKEISRIDPVFNPPLILELGDEFNIYEFKRKIGTL